MAITYEQIPLHLLIKKEDFEQAEEIYLRAFTVDIHFAKTYLARLPTKAKLRILVERADPQVLEFLQRQGTCRYQYLQLKDRKLLGYKELLIQTPKSKYLILTSSNFTVQGLEDENARHRFSENESEFQLLQRKYLLRNQLS